MQKQEKRRETRLKRFWKSPKTTSSEDSAGCDSPTKHRTRPHLQESPVFSKPTCSLPLLQVWPSQDSPRGEADGQSFIFPILPDDHRNDITVDRRNSLYIDPQQTGDSGIDSIQASPSPNAFVSIAGVSSGINISPCASPPNESPTPSLTKPRRLSSALLHPDHARLLALRQQQVSPDQTSIEDTTEFNGSGACGIQICTASSSTTSSLTSIAAASITQQRLSDPWLQTDRIDNNNRRRSSTMTARYSLFDALDLEYALLRAAARGSVGPYSLSESLHKLTFTQSLAFPALARGLATKRRRSADQSTSRPLNPNESGFNTFAKVITAIVLVMVSFLVFLVIYKFVRT
ncbi:uncharacterized protein LOC119070673 [Bradysia coprophila]|uniref:uncharacterized protein LOC119070673 n=1 Tax=Bradysia coprophila TaxID=38358 RepID=UPI00187DC4DD|nr:uncharacterized protein LOC119070673 [Bradysia coprophila]